MIADIYNKKHSLFLVPDAKDDVAPNLLDKRCY